jgi:hypothetical protein
MTIPHRLRSWSGRTICPSLLQFPRRTARALNRRLHSLKLVRTLFPPERHWIRLRRREHHRYNIALVYHDITRSSELRCAHAASLAIYGVRVTNPRPLVFRNSELQHVRVCFMTPLCGAGSNEAPWTVCLR